MQLGVLKTDYGPHPVEKWARVTAWQITNHLVQVDENDVRPDAVAVREARDDMERTLYGVLKKHHGAVQAGERAKIKEHGYERLNHPLRANEADRNEGVAEHVNVDDVVAAVADAAKVHPVLREHFGKDEVKAQVAEIFRKDAASVMDIERDWHANGHRINDQGRAVARDDHDPRDPAVKAFLARHGSNAARAEGAV
jgi:hypothetical protein